MVSPRTEITGAGEMAGRMGGFFVVVCGRPVSRAPASLASGARPPWRSAQHARFLIVPLILCLVAGLAFGADMSGHIDGVRRGDFQRATGDLLPLAKQGDPRAQYLLGTIYLNHYVDAPSPDEAARWIHRAAEQNFIPAQMELARMYRNGDGVARDPEKTAYWYGQAAENGDVGGQLFIADAYAYGLGIERDRVQAYKWYGIAMQYWGSLAVRARDAVAAEMTADEIKRAEMLVTEWLKAKGK